MTIMMTNDVETAWGMNEIQMTPKKTVTQQRAGNPPVTDVVISSTMQCIYILASGLLLVMLGGVFAILHFTSGIKTIWEPLMYVCFAISLTPFLFGGIGLLVNYFQKCKLNRIKAGDYLVHWTFSESQWQEECDRAESFHQWILPITVLCCGGLGLCVGLLAYEDGNLVAGSLEMHVAAFTLIPIVFGYLLGMFFLCLSSMTLHLKKTHTAQVLIGKEGVYVTGQFWPTSSYGQWIHKISITQQHPSHITFTLAISTKNGTQYNDVLIPIPDGKLHEAHAVIEQLLNG